MKNEKRRFADAASEPNPTESALHDEAGETLPKIDPYQFVTAAELLAENDVVVEPLVDGLLGCGSSAMICAKPKVGKSTFLTHLAVCVARGAPFLGRRTRQGPVLYCALEGNRREWRTILRSMNATENDELHIYIGSAPEKSKALAWLRVNAERLRPVLIIVDPLQKLVRLKDVADYAEVSNAIESLIAAIANPLDATLVLAHHAGKADREDGDAVLGSTALFGGVDSLITLKKDTKGRRSLATIQRWLDDQEDVVVHLDPQTRALSLAGKRSELDQAEAERHFLKVLAADQWIEQATLFADTEARRGTKLAALRSLLGQGKIERTGAGRKGDPFRYALRGASVKGPEAATTATGKRAEHPSEPALPGTPIVVPEDDFVAPPTRGNYKADAPQTPVVTGFIPVPEVWELETKTPKPGNQNTHEEETPLREDSSSQNGNYLWEPQSGTVGLLSPPREASAKAPASVTGDGLEGSGRPTGPQSCPSSPYAWMLGQKPLHPRPILNDASRGASSCATGLAGIGLLDYARLRIGPQSAEAEALLDVIVDEVGP